MAIMFAYSNQSNDTSDCEKDDQKEGSKDQMSGDEAPWATTV
jgi:hypothetical protein